MKNLALLFISYFIIDCSNLADLTSAEEISEYKICANATKISVAVNLLDEECLKRAETANTEIERNNSVEVRGIEMKIYSVCLLKKASIMNGEGKVNAHFDILKIIQHLYKKSEDPGFGLIFVIRALDRCRRFEGTDETNTAMKIMKCLIDHQETILRCE